MLIGTDSYQFEVVEPFIQLHDNIRLGVATGVCVDTSDQLYVFNQSQTPVLIFDRHGKFLRTWGEDYQRGAHGMRLTREDNGQFLYLTDVQQHIVVKSTLRGLEQFTITAPPRPDIYPLNSDFKPTDACVAPTGDIYVMDGEGKPYVHVYTRKGKYLLSIGGEGDGGFGRPHGGWIDTRRPEPELYVADPDAHCIEVFALDGTHRRTIEDPAIQEPVGFYQFADELHVADRASGVVILDAHDKVVAVLNVEKAHALCLDERGDIYVAQQLTPGRITKLVRKSALPALAQPPVGHM